MRVGVVGLGKMGLLHAAIFNSLPGSRVIAVAEPSALPRKAASEFMPSVRVHESLDDMLATGGLDAVVITTPVAEHVPVALRCVESRVPFFVEKPLATSARQADRLVAALARRPTPNMVGFMTRHVDAFEKARGILLTGCLGRLQRVTGTIYVSQLFTLGKGWRYDRVVAGGGVLLSQGSHLLDLLTWYFGPVARVNAEIQSLYSIEVEDAAHAMLEFESGLRGWVDCCWSVRFRRTVETTIDVLGDNGALVVTDDMVCVFLDRQAGGLSAGTTMLTAVDLFRPVEVDVGGPQYTREVQAFLDALCSGRHPEPDVAQALHVQRIVDAAYSSARRAGAPERVER
ncbi:MAG: Gfo/Idh/MocA family oxidoreductase [Candidatus Rokubacteria bacterium]|nr:Gfo/Idh/MocA family oxidoreductase [Candidatus Rokubacteria bacterium]